MMKIAALPAVFFLRTVANKVEVTVQGHVVGAYEDSFAAVDLNKDGFISRDEHAHHQRALALAALAAKTLSLTGACSNTNCCTKNYGNCYYYDTSGNADNCKAKDNC